MGPDPEKVIRDSNFEQHSVINNQLDDEMDIEMEDNERNNNNGYLMLNSIDNDNEFMPANDSDDDSEDDEDENEISIPVTAQQQAPNVPEILPASSEIVSELWNQKPNNSNIEMTNEKSQQITQIMSKINLPNAPDWLNELTTKNDENSKTKLSEKLILMLKKS